MMYLRYITYLFFWIASTLIGLIAYPILPKDRHHKTKRGFGKFKWSWAQAIWGNPVDGLSGDMPYRMNQAQAWFRKPISWWWWSCIRNPSNNLERQYLSARGIISSIEKSGAFTVVTFADGRRYFFYYNKDVLGYKNCKLGWKFWEDQISIGEQYEAEFVCL